MGLFSSKKKTKTKEDSEYRFMTVDEALTYSMDKPSRRSKKDKKKERTRVGRVSAESSMAQLLEDTCSQLLALKKQRIEAETEYNAVSRYLEDIRCVDSIPAGDRMDIDDIAKTIVNLSHERHKYQNSEKRMSDNRYNRLQMYESRLPAEIKLMEERERYQAVIQNDLRQLEGEKGTIKYNSEQAIKKRSFLRKFSLMFCSVIVGIFLLLILLSNSTGKDFIVPFFINGVAAIGYMFFFLISMKSSADIIKQTTARMNRVIYLLNKVKIKYVNTTNLLEYSYEKYEVNSFHELQYVWELYMKTKEEEARYKKNTQLLASYQNALIEALNRWQLFDSEIWVHQPMALIDKKEMVEVRHRLNARRQKLRAQIDFIGRQQDVGRNEIESLKLRFRGQEAMIKAVLEEYHLEE